MAIHFAVNPANPKDNFTFKCHRSNGSTNAMQDIYAVSSLKGIIPQTIVCGFYESLYVAKFHENQPSYKKIKAV